MSCVITEVCWEGQEKFVFKQTILLNVFIADVHCVIFSILNERSSTTFVFGLCLTKKTKFWVRHCIPMYYDRKMKPFQDTVTCQTRTALVKFSLRNLTVYFLLCQLARSFLDCVSSLPCGLAVYWRPRPLGTRQYIHVYCTLIMF